MTLPAGASSSQRESGISLWLGVDTGPQRSAARTLGSSSSARSDACESPRKVSSLVKVEKLTRVAVKATP